MARWAAGVYVETEPATPPEVPDESSSISRVAGSVAAGGLRDRESVRSCDHIDRHGAEFGSAVGDRERHADGVGYVRLAERFPYPA